MKFVCRLLPAALLFGVTTTLAAETSVVRGEAASAFESGDYALAVRLYSQSRESASKRGDSRGWGADTLALARAYLRSGSPKRARQLLTEFERRFPALESGNLKGEILAAEGRTREAKAFFRELAANPAAGARGRGEAELALAYLQMLSGDRTELAEALKILEQLERDAHFATEARLRRIYTLIRSGRVKEAQELADKTRFGAAPSRRRLELLKLLALLYSGAEDEFYARWMKSRADILPSPDKLAFDTMVMAAEKALKGSHPERAMRYWDDAYGFADRDEVRRDVLRRLFNCCAAVDAREAVKVAERYALIFPSSGADAGALTDRAEILTGAGRLLGKAGDHREALKFFKMVADDGKLPIEYRRAAAMDAAATAEKLNDHVMAKYYFESLAATARDRRQLLESQICHAEYLIRRGDFSAAEQLLRGISGEIEPELKDRVAKSLIKVLYEQRKFEAAFRAAEELRRSADAKNAGFGEFCAAQMAEKLERHSEARERYLKYCRNRPNGEFVRQARFFAALLAERTRDYAAAAKEFYAYGEAYPKAPDAGDALFRAVRSGCTCYDLKLALAAFETLRREVGAGTDYYLAAMQLANHMLRSNNPAAALEVLDKVDRSKCSGSEAAMLSLMRARVLDARHRLAPPEESARLRGEAIAVAEQLLTDHPDDPVAADAAFLAGELYLEGENPAKAQEMMEMALKRRKLGEFTNAAEFNAALAGFKLFEANGSTSELEKAEKAFKRLSYGDSTDPDIRLQSGYMLGRCCEKLNKPEQAVKAYRRTLKYARKLKRERRRFDPKWCSRSVYAALNILTKEEWSDVEQNGVEIINLAEELELPGGDAQFKQLEKEFKARLKR